MLQRIGEVAYKLLLPAQSRIHPAFQVPLFKKSLGARNESSAELPIQPDRGTWIPSRILSARTAMNDSTPEWLIQWEGYTEDKATWENSAALLARYPFFKACGQAFSQGDEDDGIPNPSTSPPHLAKPIITYVRRNK